MSTLFERVLTRMRSYSREDWEEFDVTAAELRKVVPGWANGGNYGFFKALIAEVEPEANILMCGVYHGMDLRLLSDFAGFLNKPVNLYGVDLFADQPYDDWTPEQKAAGRDWMAAIGSSPPSYPASKANCPSAKLFLARSAQFMAMTPVKFDAIYLDTAHDYANVLEEIRASRHCLKTDSVLCGDDYSSKFETYGVEKAVRELLPIHHVLFGRVWLADPNQSLIVPQG